jgi:hypothetical protein
VELLKQLNLVVYLQELGLVVEIDQQEFKEELVLDLDLQVVLQQQEIYIHQQ